MSVFFFITIFFLIIRAPPVTTRPDTRFPHTTFCRSTGALSVQASSVHSPRVAPGRGRSADFDRLPGEDATRLVQDPALLADACLSGSFRAGHPRGRYA